MSNIDIIHSIFKEHFGEDNVDLQQSTTNSNFANIIVRFPDITIENEYNQSTNIKDLFAKIIINKNTGYLDSTFKLIRSTYTRAQFNSGYKHSHLPRIDSYNLFNWDNPCLGGGPIRDTCVSLNTCFSEELWQLFCVELDLYVRTESRAGGPYISVENIFTDTNTDIILSEESINMHNYSSPPSMIKIIINDLFIPYLAYNLPFELCNHDNTLTFNISMKDLYIKLSNLFIKFHNEHISLFPSTLELLSAGIIIQGQFKGNKLIVHNDNMNPMSSSPSIIGQTVLMFKGEEIPLKVETSTTQVDSNYSTFIAIDLFKYIYIKIFLIANYYDTKDITETNHRTIFCI